MFPYSVFLIPFLRVFSFITFFTRLPSSYDSLRFLLFINAGVAIFLHLWIFIVAFISKVSLPPAFSNFSCFRYLLILFFFFFISCLSLFSFLSHFSLCVRLVVMIFFYQISCLSLVLLSPSCRVSPQLLRFPLMCFSSISLVPSRLLSAPDEGHGDTCASLVPVPEASGDPGVAGLTTHPSHLPYWPSLTCLSVRNPGHTFHTLFTAQD